MWRIKKCKWKKAICKHKSIGNPTGHLFPSKKHNHQSISHFRGDEWPAYVKNRFFPILSVERNVLNRRVCKKWPFVYKKIPLVYVKKKNFHIFLHHSIGQRQKIFDSFDQNPWFQRSKPKKSFDQIDHHVQIGPKCQSIAKKPIA